MTDTTYAQTLGNALATWGSEQSKASIKQSQADYQNALNQGMSDNYHNYHNYHTAGYDMPISALIQPPQQPQFLTIAGLSDNRKRPKNVF